MRGRFTVAFSGGSLPGLLCPGLVNEPLRSTVAWPAWHVFWVDERCVPLTDPLSNYRRLREQLLDRVAIPAEQVHPVDTALDPETAARAYQADLVRTFRSAPDEWPRFDVILLGLGEDGHTASLFPGHALLRETRRRVAPVFDSPKPPPERITLTLPVLNQARHVTFITAGAGKAAALARVWGPDNAPKTLPAQLVQPVRGQVTWFVWTSSAASRLRGGQ